MLKILVYGCGKIANKMIDYLSTKNLKSIKIAYASYLKMYAKNILNWDGNENNKPREFLQQLGVELIKNNIDSKMLINRIIEDIKVYSYFFDIAIITDARLDKEIISLKKAFRDVISINIERPNLVSELTGTEQAHVTETGLDNFNDYDYVIINDGSLEDLEKKVIEIGETIK